MEKLLQNLQAGLSDVRKLIVDHALYQEIQTIDDLKVFMRYHVYAVWDFMSLLKSLQIGLTCTTIPWFPVGSGSTRALINEIVAGEESDLDALGMKKSHFEMYLDAMDQCGADTTEVNRFISALKDGQSLLQAYDRAGTPVQARDFVDFTFSLIEEGSLHQQAAAFTFGREDLIPEMFHVMVNDLNERFQDKVSLFKYYLDRHIEVDGDQHSHLALEMTAELCGQSDSNWDQAAQASRKALERRNALWDGALAEILVSRSN